MDRLNHEAVYRHHLESLRQTYPDKTAFELAIGGNFDAVGDLEYRLLKRAGLNDKSHLIDVGCGSGRLPKALYTAGFEGSFLGLDILEELIIYARKLTPKSNFRYQHISNFQIPASDESTDFITFFSVFTHLLLEESFLYLKEAKRVLKPGGMLIFTFLELREAAHWKVFQQTIKNLGKPIHLNSFIERSAIETWASRLAFTFVETWAGSEPFIPALNGTKEKFGQSVAILKK